MALTGSATRERDEALIAALTALASETRLSLLRQLQRASVLNEIRVFTADPGGERDRPLTRQTIAKHLRILMDAGAVNATSVEREYGETLEYVVNHRRLFALSEELRELARLKPLDVTDADPTVENTRETDPSLAYPRLLVVRGLDEGRAFRLARTRGEASWLVGRKRDAAISLDYDPFVSHENSIIRHDGSAFTVESLPGSRNGTTLNFKPLEASVSVRVAHGDVLGVGRSLLVLQEHDPRER